MATIRSFNVVNTTTGQMTTSGRKTTNQMAILYSENQIRTNTAADTPIPGAPSTITSGPLYGVGYFPVNVIQLTRTFYTVLSAANSWAALYVPDGRVRFTFLGGADTTNANTIAYGFSASATAPTSLPSLYVAMASSLAQTAGDYFDVSIPADVAQASNVWLVVCVLRGAWEQRTIETNNTCSVSTSATGVLTYCMNPALSLSDVNLAHFVGVLGANEPLGMFVRESFGVEGPLLADGNKSYASFRMAVSSATLDTLETNEESVVIPACFLAGTLIRCRCLAQGETAEVPIEQLASDTDRWQVLLHDGSWGRIRRTIKYTMVSKSRHLHFSRRLYCMPSAAGLTLSGGHSVLVLEKDLTPNQRSALEQTMGGLHYVGQYVRLLCWLDDRFQVVERDARETVFHIEIDTPEHMVGIYANGVLCESLSNDWIGHM